MIIEKEICKLFGANVFVKVETKDEPCEVYKKAIDLNIAEEFLLKLLEEKLGKTLQNDNR